MIKAPEFKLADQNGEMHSLHDYHGRWLVLYFYPKDDTAGCTAEACSFRDGREVIAELGSSEIVGVSTDSVASHKKFADKHHLNFTLLSDPDHHIVEAYDSWKQRTFNGQEYTGTVRTTFIIDPEGNIAKTYNDVNPEEHALRIIEDLKTLRKST